MTLFKPLIGRAIFIVTFIKEFKAIKGIDKTIIIEKNKNYTYVNNLYHNLYKLSIGELVEEKTKIIDNKKQ
ncbi:hypothetical protein [Helicovermis profundi]|uniref:hypothetical protein n=1 Tax=Helicovermis profundi TaxID=3065157 RepID=UPI0030CF4937